MFLRQDGKCHNFKSCGTKLAKGNYIIEHGVPLSRGGNNSLENKYLNCLECADKKTFHPRSKATTLGGDLYEAAKTKRLERGKKKSGRKWPKRKFGQ